jgi:uncharacterized membrane protein
MNREEFIQQLSEQLMGNVSEAERMDSIRYYREYIEEQMRTGKSEEEVLDSLGSAYGIAKSIIEAKGYGTEDTRTYDSYSGDWARDEIDEREEERTGSGPKIFHVSGWKAGLTIVGIFVVLFLILSLLFKVFFAILPFLIPFLLVLFLLRLFTDR